MMGERVHPFAAGSVIYVDTNILFAVEHVILCVIHSFLDTSSQH
jgi:hypothetical protein